MAQFRFRTAGGVVTALAVIATLVAGCGSAPPAATTAPSDTAASPSRSGPSSSPSSAAPSATTKPTNTTASTGGPINLRGPWTTFSDRRDDAPPAVDITRVSFANVGKYATVRYTIAHLNWRGSFWVFLARGDDEEGTLMVDLTAHQNHTTTLRLRAGSRSGPFKLKCAGVSSRYDVTREEVLVQVPRSCIPPKEDPTVEFGAETVLFATKSGDDINTHNPLQHEALITHSH